MIPPVAPDSPRRSLMFTPGDSESKIARAAASAADTIILDLEDAVAVSRKSAARDLVVAALNRGQFTQKECLVRTNGWGTPFFQDDLAAVAGADVTGIVVPKVASGGQLRAVDQAVTAVEADRGRPAGSLRLLVLLETARGIVNAAEIAGASRRLDGLLFGAEDLAADLSAVRTRSGWEVFHGRSVVVTAAAAFGLPAIDTVFVDFKDAAGLEADAAFARQLGFSGKLVIHPAQIDACNRIFAPTAAEIARALELLAAHRAHQERGEGVFALQGRMVDEAVVRSAGQLLQRARQCGLLN